MFSHGLTGLIVMLGSIINQTIELYISNPSYLVILIVAALFFIFGFFNIVLGCINLDFQYNGPRSKCLLFFLIGLAIVSVATTLIRLGVI